jgi:hypothetical protein
MKRARDETNRFRQNGFCVPFGSGLSGLWDEFWFGQHRICTSKFMRRQSHLTFQKLTRRST